MLPDFFALHGPVRVLVVDDHPFFREGIATWIGRQSGLEYCGYADSPRAAAIAIETLKPHVVLLDLHLRDGDGLDVLRTLQSSSHRPHVIVVSHKDETIFAERTLRAGAHGYVLKEEASDAMLVAIQVVLNGGIYLSQTMRRQLYEKEPNPAPTPADKLRTLYNREFQVLRLLGRGRTTKEIASELGISPKTVESYRENLKKKLGVPDSVTLVRLATVWEVEGRLSP